MNYQRFEKLQKYYLGQPVEPSIYKQGSSLGIADYSSLASCEGGGSGTDPEPVYYYRIIQKGYICEGYDKYTKYVKQYAPYSDGPWNDVVPEEYFVGDLIEVNSTDCGYIPTPITRWVTVPGQYSCVGYDKYNKEKEEISYDSGSTWTDTGNTRAGSTLIEQNSEDCGYVPTQYLTTEALGYCNISLKRYRDAEHIEDQYPLKNIMYSKNGGTWTSYTYGTNISVATGDNIRWKAQMDTVDNNYADMLYSYFSATGEYKVYGNPLSLIFNDEYDGVIDLSKYNLTRRSYILTRLFYNSSTLIDASELKLVATTLSEYCYQEMFRGCTSLIAAPELPAITLASNCYYGMFYGCTSLTTAPVLPATTLAVNCYYEMFRGCTSLIAAPELPAITLTERCYRNMFMRCSSLNYIKCLATNISANNCTTYWTEGVAANGTFVKASSMTSWIAGNNGIPSGWTVQDA